MVFLLAHELSIELSPRLRRCPRVRGPSAPLDGPRGIRAFPAPIAQSADSVLFCQAAFLSSCFCQAAAKLFDSVISLPLSYERTGGSQVDASDLKSAVNKYSNSAHGTEFASLRSSVRYCARISGPRATLNVLVEFGAGGAVGFFGLARLERELSTILGGRRVGPSHASGLEQIFQRFCDRRGLHHPWTKLTLSGSDT